MPECRATVEAHLDAQGAVLAEVGEEMLPLLDAVSALLGGGKRLRAAFLYWGYRAGGGADSDAVVRAATAMEFFQAAALLHDDVMDDSDTRRGLPAAHRRLAGEHAEQGWTGNADRFGIGGRHPRRRPVPDLERRAVRHLGPRPATSWPGAGSCSTGCAPS